MESTSIIAILASILVVGLIIVIVLQNRKYRQGFLRNTQGVKSLESERSPVPTPQLRRQALTRLRHQLDSAVAEASTLISTELYSNCILPIVREWFEGNDSIKQLNNSIESSLKKRWKTVEPKVLSRFASFAEEMKVTLSDVASANMSFNSEALSQRISERLALSLGVIATTITAIISGGAGTALIMTGPIGIVIGAVIGSLAFFFGKKKIEEIMGSFLVDKHIPRLMKKPAMSKVTAELKLKEVEFKEDVEMKMQEMVKPVYKEIDDEIARLV